MLVECNVLRFDGLRRNFETLRDLIAVEEVMRLYVNGEFYTVFHCTPSKVKELTLGRLLTDGLIEEVEEVLGISISDKNIHVKLSGEKTTNIEKTRLISAILEGAPPDRILKVLHRLRASGLRFNADVIFRAAEVLNSRAEVFRASGGTHAAALVNDNCETIAFAEDIGRHNAVDKVVGEAATKGADFCRLILASTGRLTSEIVLKAAWIGVPVMVSPSASTSMSIKLAEALGLTLVGFVRGGRFNIYASPDRIIS